MVASVRLVLPITVKKLNNKYENKAIWWGLSIEISGLDLINIHVCLKVTASLTLHSLSSRLSKQNDFAVIMHGDIWIGFKQ